MKLPIFDIITEAISDTWENRRDLMTFAFLPVLMVSIIGTVIAAAVGDPQLVVNERSQTTAQITVAQFLGSVVMLITVFIFYSLFAVAWHRRILVGPEATTVGAALHWGRRQWLFFGRIASLMARLIALMILLSATITFMLQGVLPVIAILAAIFIAMGMIYARSALVLPGVATDKPMTFAQSMRLTRGNSWNLVIAIVLLPLGIMFVTRIVVTLIEASLAGILGPSVTAGFIFTLIVVSVSYFAAAIGITALSLAYRQLTT